MKPNYAALDTCLMTHPDYVLECEVRDKGFIDFTSMTDEEMDEFQQWLSRKGYEIVEYIDKRTRLADSAWLNEKHQEAIAKLRQLAETFFSLHSYPRWHISRQRVNKIADEAMEILTTLHSMVLVKHEVEAIQ